MKKLCFLLCVPLLMSACNTSEPEPTTDDTVPPPALGDSQPAPLPDTDEAEMDDDMIIGDGHDNDDPDGHEEQMDTEDDNTLSGETITIEVENTPDGDMLLIAVDDTIIPFELPVETMGDTEAYTIVNSNDTIALFYNYWAGAGDLVRVRHTGLKLTIEHMGIGEPHPEFGAGCEPWNEIGKVDIGLAQDFDVQPGAEKLEYRSEFDCDCQETGNGFICV